MKRRVLAMVVGMALTMAFAPVYAENGEAVESQISAPVQAPEPTKEPSIQPTEAPKAEASKEHETASEAAETPSEKPAQEPFSAKGKVELKNKGQIYFGDKVTLKAVVKEANAKYDVYWDYYNVDADVAHGEDPWVQVNKGEKYEFVVNEENAVLTYRVRANDLVIVKECKLPEVLVKPVEEPEEVEETEEPVEPDEVEETEEPVEPDEVEETEEPVEPEEAEETEEPAEPEETAEPQEPEVSEEPDETEEPEEAPALDPDRSIEIHAEWEGEELFFGDEVVLVAELSGYENVEYVLQWQTSKDEAEWVDVAGATEASYTMVVTEENYLEYWRVIVTVLDILPDEAA